MTRSAGNLDGASLSFRTTDLDEARTVLGRAFYANSMHLVDRDRPLAAEFEVFAFGPLVIGDLSCGATVRMEVGELGSYHVSVALSGALAFRQGPSEQQLANVKAAAVFQPVGDTAIDQWDGDCRLYAVKIEREALEARLAELLDVPVRSPVRLSPTMDVTQGYGRTFARLIELITDEVAYRDSLVLHPLMAEQFTDTLLRGLLLATEHQYRDRLDRPTRHTAAPPAVRRAMDAMQAYPDQPFTTARLAELAGVGERALQDGFQRHLGLSPMAYLRRTRLARVREELRQADPRTATVTEVAVRWGFAHLGRFAAAYQERYGEAPSATLRGFSR